MTALAIFTAFVLGVGLGCAISAGAHADAKPDMSPQSFAALDRDVSRVVGKLSRN